VHRASVRSRRPADGSAGAADQFLLFGVGEVLCGLPVDGLWEVMPPEGVTELPTPAHQVCTALAYRGHRLPLVRMAELFGAGTDRVPATARVLLLEAHGRPFGILVDRVLEMLEVPPGAIARMPSLATTLALSLFRGVCARPGGAVVLLSPEGLGELPDVRDFRGE